jgi:type IV pilus assembly protein PilB
MKKKRLGEVLRERGHVSAADLNAALQEQQGQTKLVHLGELLLQRGLVTKPELTSALLEVAQVPYVDCTSVQVNPEILQLIPGTMARRCHALPIEYNGSELIVAMAEPQNLQNIDELRFKTGKSIAPRFAFRREIDVAITKYYGPAEVTHTPVIADATREEDRTIEFISSSEQKRNRSKQCGRCRSN